jgi:hypothetical protein
MRRILEHRPGEGATREAGGGRMEIRTGERSRENRLGTGKRTTDKRFGFFKPFPECLRRGLPAVFGGMQN